MTQTITPVAMNTPPRRWQRLPSDGTSYAYWKSDDGCVVETKPRFRPAIGYSLSVPPAVTGLDRFLYASFRTLREAQEAVRLPVDQLTLLADQEAAARAAFFRNGTSQEAVHA